jgi:hypothetical protein
VSLTRTPFSPPLQVSFATTQELMDVRRELMPAIARNKAASEAEARLASVFSVPLCFASAPPALIQPALPLPLPQDAFDVQMGETRDASGSARRIADFIVRAHLPNTRLAVAKMTHLC